MADPRRGDASGRVARLIGPAAIVAAFAAMLAWTWRQWPDVVVDSGQQLHLAWRLAEGKILYRDVLTFAGPLSPHVNALWMRLFGTSLMAVVAGNLLVLVGIVVLIHDLARRAAGRLGADVATLTFVIVFAFGQHVGIGNYQYAFPYVHEMTHGLLLALAALRCSLASLDATTALGRIGWAGAAGLAVGCVALTRPEPLVAAGASSLAMLLLGSVPLRSGFTRGSAFLGAAFVPGLAVLDHMSLTLSGTGALDALARPHAMALGGQVAALPFYRAGMGLDDPAGRAMAMALAFGALLLVLVPLAVAGALRRRGRGAALPAGVAIGVGVMLLALMDGAAWRSSARPLPIVMAVGAVALAALAWRERDASTRARLALRLGWCVLGGAFLLKMALNARVDQYGFVLAAPACLATLLLLVAWLPERIDARGGDGRLVRWPALALVAVACVTLVRDQAHWVRGKTVVVGSGGDAFLADRRGEIVVPMLEQIEQRVPKDATLLALPDGLMVSYLAKRPTSVPYLNLLPTELIVLGGEQRVVAGLTASPPDWICVVSNNAPEDPRFGLDYGAKLRAWIDSRYELVVRSGEKPGGRWLGIDLMKRKD